MCLARRLGVYPTPSGPGDPGAVWIYLEKYPLPKLRHITARYGIYVSREIGNGV